MRTIEAMRFGDEICLTHNTKTWCTHDIEMMYSRYRHGVLTIQTWCTHDTDMVYSRYRHGVLTIQTWCTHVTDMVYSRYRHGVLTVLFPSILTSIQVAYCQTGLFQKKFITDQSLHVGHPITLSSKNDKHSLPLEYINISNYLGK